MLSQKTNRDKNNGLKKAFEYFGNSKDFCVHYKCIHSHRFKSNGCIMSITYVVGENVVSIVGFYPVTKWGGSVRA